MVRLATLGFDVQARQGTGNSAQHQNPAIPAKMDALTRLGEKTYQNSEKMGTIAAARALT
jgi:hypothetical protein